MHTVLTKVCEQHAFGAFNTHDAASCATACVYDQIAGGGRPADFTAYSAATPLKISTYIENIIDNDFSGNVIGAVPGELIPIKPGAFKVAGVV
jgi:hypothetical protein